MKLLLCIISVLLYCISASAQDTSVIYIKAGTNIHEAVSREDAFYYPQFKTGKVFFKDRNTGQARVNYNLLLDEMHFIDLKGDTLAIDNEKMINIVIVDKDSFYYNEGFVKLLSNSNDVKLAVKHSYRVLEKHKIGGYNMANPTSSITSYSTYFDGNSVYKLTVKEDIVLKKIAQYYISNKYNLFVPATRKNVLSLLPKKEKIVSAYLTDHAVDFNKRSDLEKLVVFLSQL